jgi:hypothetical protein
LPMIGLRFSMLLSIFEKTEGLLLRHSPVLQGLSSGLDLASPTTLGS